MSRYLVRVQHQATRFESTGKHLLQTLTTNFIQMPSISTNSLVVVTGINGYIASHAALTLLREGHHVCGTIRPASMGRITEDLKKAFVNNGIPTKIVQERLEFFGIEGNGFTPKKPGDVFSME
ncbi:hypothetical protein M422DRAFT_777038 [Sphaerobolus stellatus SS14]|nr:hypothetical protein M422DRAFT_777038 [Sphaerobolus stellatus SS14]